MEKLSFQWYKCELSSSLDFLESCNKPSRYLLSIYYVPVTSRYFASINLFKFPSTSLCRYYFILILLISKIRHREVSCSVTQ